ncbi:MAG: tetratricopeptide repeat protein [Nannocystaceae bacterium]|nr:tetratricopeptide repeat protein [Myxococcales bacterium]
MRSILAAVAVTTVLGLTGCQKIAARDLIREANALYRNSQYEEAIEKYNEAEGLEPDGVTLYWNRACAAESLVLKLKDPNKADVRKKYTDLALSDFKTWLDRLEAPEEADKKEFEKHRLVLLKADERCDDLLNHYLARHNAEPNNEDLYSLIARQYDECGRIKEADEWFVKRTVDFPKSPRGFVALAIRRFDPLWPDPESGEQYNPNVAPGDRLRLADTVLKLLEQATLLDPKLHEAYAWKSMAFTQRALAHPYSDVPEEHTLEEKLNVILSREDTLEGWKQQKARCDIDQLPECDPNKTPEEQGQCCPLPPRPISIEEQAADNERKKEILAQIEEAKQEAESGNAKGKGKGKGKRRGK